MTSLTQQFIERYGETDEPIRQFFAPGRVNLIGDHIDYNGGLVFPCAINHGTTLLIRKSNDNTVKLASTDFDLMAVLSESETQRKYGDHWINYPLGVLQQFRQAAIGMTGVECLYSGNLPSAAGLSSSASIEVVTAFALNQLHNAQFDLLEIACLSQRAENDFVGVQCGIMDQYAVCMGQEDHAMKLNCQSLQHDQIPLSLGDYKILLVNTNQRRELSESKYNERVTETQKALSLMQTVSNVKQLADVSLADLEHHQELFSNYPTHYKRARHVVTEQARVIQAVDALKNGDLPMFGNLMYQSHDSLALDYGVSSDPLNLLVDLTRDDPGVIGSRLTGAGFGGCTVNLIHKDHIQAFIEQTGKAYLSDIGLTATFLLIDPSQGVREQNVTDSAEIVA